MSGYVGVKIRPTNIHYEDKFNISLWAAMAAMAATASTKAMDALGDSRLSYNSLSCRYEVSPYHKYSFELVEHSGGNLLVF
jgi:hypothetical protein